MSRDLKEALVCTPVILALGGQRYEDHHSLRPALSTWQVPGQPGLYNKTLSQKKKRKGRKTAVLFWQEIL